MKIDFKRNFKLVDNGDLTQNLHSLCYQNNILISEIDLGNVEDILVKSKNQQEIIDKTKEAIQSMLHYGYFISDTTYLTPQNEDTIFGVRAIELLKILEDKED